MLWSSRFLITAVLAAFTPDGSVLVPPVSGGQHFFDGHRSVVATRAGPVVARPELTAVRLYYPAYDLWVDGAIDRTAIIELAAGESAALLARYRLEVRRPLAPEIGLYLVAADDSGDGDGLDIAVRLRDAPGIRSAIPNLYLERTHFAAFTPNDPSFGAQWYFDRLSMTDAWGLEMGDPAVVITVIDSGCDLAHPDLAAKMEAGKDTVSDDDDPSPNLADPSAAHGTACAGIIAAETNNALGIAGACPECRLSCVRMLGPPGESIPLDSDVQAFAFAKQSGAAVVSNSWGFSSAFPVPSALSSVINDVFDNGRGGLGAAVLFAAGNEDREVFDYELLGVRGVLGVGAINNYYDSTVYTNFGAPVDVVAPTGTMTTDISGTDGYDSGDYTATFGGTSSACPVVAGIAALLISADPTLTAAEVHDLLVQTAIQAPYAAPDANGHDVVFGYGIVNPVGALQEVLGVGGSGGAGGVGGTGGAGGTAGSGGSATGGVGGVGGSVGGGGDSGVPSGGGCAALPAHCWWPFLAALFLRRRRQ